MSRRGQGGRIARLVGRRRSPAARRGAALGRAALGAASLGALAVGAIAVGAVAIRALAIRSPVGRHLGVARLEVGELRVRSVHDPLQAPGA
jgi:hypothetical protein